MLDHRTMMALQTSTEESMCLFEQAKNWRQENGYVGRGGVIMVFQGAVEGWVNMLRNPERWRPGCIAIDEEGRIWRTGGGTDEGGALTWLPDDLIEY